MTQGHGRDRNRRRGGGVRQSQARPCRSALPDSTGPIPLHRASRATSSVIETHESVGVASRLQHPGAAPGPQFACHPALPRPTLDGLPGFAKVPTRAHRHTPAPRGWTLWQPAIALARDRQAGGSICRAKVGAHVPAGAVRAFPPVVCPECCDSGTHRTNPGVHSHGFRNMWRPARDSQPCLPRQRTKPESQVALIRPARQPETWVQGRGIWGDALMGGGWLGSVAT